MTNMRSNMKIIYVMLSLLWVIAITACSPKTPEEKPTGVLSNAQQRTLDKAQETEEILKKADEERRRKLDEMEGQ